MNDIFNAVEARPKRIQGITGQTIEAMMRGTMCQITEWELGALRDEITRLTAELLEAEDRANSFATKEMHTERRAKKAEAERDQEREEHTDTLELLDHAQAEIARLKALVSRWQNYGCPDCSGDCGSANPPMTCCIMQETREALAAHRQRVNAKEGRR